MDQSTLRNLAAEVGKKLKAKNLKLVTVESCTGGGLGYLITCIPGSSQWFDRGFITYSDQAKIDMVGVKKSTLKKFGAVSEQTAREMAEGGLKKSEADLSVAITGIAGPDGGTPQKPVGTVLLSWARKKSRTKKNHTTIVRELYYGNRQQIRQRSIESALQGLLELIK